VKGEAVERPWFSLKRRVWVGLLAGVAGVGIWAFWSQQWAVAPATSPAAVQPFVQLAGAGGQRQDLLLRERAELFDPTPLFFPTVWNYGQQPVPESLRRQPGQVFGSFEAKQVVGDQDIAAYGIEAAPAPEKLADVLVQGNEAPFAGMGQLDLRTSTLPVRAGYLEIRRYGNSEDIVRQSLIGIQPPRADFAPVEFLVVAGPSGLIGDPILVSGSGWDEVDLFFRNYLLRSYYLGDRLAPGRYRVVIGS
jgi:hypothetical protein